MMDEDEEIDMIDSMAKAAARATQDVQRRNSAPYDGVMGKLPEWMPGNFHREFREIRNRLLIKHSHVDLLDYIIEMRDRFGCRFMFTPAEFIDYDPSAAHDSIYKPLTMEFVLGKDYDDLPLDKIVPIRTPGNIMRDVTILARFNKAVSLGPEKGLALLTDNEHAKTSAIGINARKKQTEKAKKPRGKIGDNEETNDQIVGKLALAPEYRELSAKELWLHYWGALDMRGLNPEEIELSDWKKSVIEYDFKGGRKKMTGGQFANVVSGYRKEEKSG